MPCATRLPRCARRGIALDVRVTWEAGDAERYVSEAIADGVDTIIAAGGDGTLSEVATTLAHRDESADALPMPRPGAAGHRQRFRQCRRDSRWNRCRRWS